MKVEEMIVDVSRDWVFACDVQQRFMRGLDPEIHKKQMSEKPMALPPVTSWPYYKTLIYS